LYSAKGKVYSGVEQGKCMPANQNSNQDVLQKIFQELNRPAKPGEMPRRIELCRKALALTSRETQPELWEKLQNDFASSLAQFSSGKQTENIEQAISHYQQALEVITSQVYPEQWDEIQFGLGKAYVGLIRGDRTVNLEIASTYLQNALSIYTKDAFPEKWATTQLYLGKVYSALAGDSTTDAPLPKRKKKNRNI
jgi:tetratricopeptide (TPR) repeat protein